MPGQEIKELFADLRGLAVAHQWGLFEIKGLDLFAAIDALETRAEKAEAELKELKLKGAP